MNKNTLLIYIFLLFSFSIKGQVTIGVDKPANIGAILDYSYADKRITQPTLSTDANQQYGDPFRPGLIDPCPMPGRTDAINGVSLKASQGGFAVRMVGVMKLGTNNEFNAVDEYGTKAGFWVAYVPAAGNGRNRVFLNTSIYNNSGGMDRYYSIRCKKNE